MRKQNILQKNYTVNQSYDKIYTGDNIAEICVQQIYPIQIL